MHKGYVNMYGTDITERKRAQEELRQLSIHDALTGLYNRGFFAAQMARLERGRQFPISLLMADVDRLKETNDRQGHAAGDVLLKRVAQLLTTAFRTEDVIARLGGDEFGVLLPGTGAAAANVALQRVRQVLQEHNTAHAETPIRLSFGVSTAEKRAPLWEVLKEADAGLYRDKRGHEAS
jgi:diguanylate cyclase (GGDEF)-like protein